MFEKLLNTAVNVVCLPVAAVTGVVTINKNEKTRKQAKKVEKNVSDILDDLFGI